VERWFGEITRKRIRRGTFHSVKERIAAIEDYLKIYNQQPKPFRWTKTAAIDELRKVCQTATGELQTLLALGIYSGLRLVLCRKKTHNNQ